MLDEVALLFSHWLAQAGTDGVNTIAQAMPRANVVSGDPDYPAPPSVAVVNDVEDKSVAANLDPDTVPALVVWGETDAEVKRVQGYPIAKQVVACAAYVTADDADPLTAIRDCGTVLRAGRISLFLRYNSANRSAAFRKLNGIQVLSIDSVNAYRITGAVGRRKMWGFLEIRATVVETLT